MANVTIHKQELMRDNKTVLQIQKGAWWLDIQLQRGIPVLWYKCDPDAELETITIIGLVTGAVWHDHHKLEYIATCQYLDGDFNVHYFKVQEE